MGTKVAIWDPNPFNPYGAELQRVLSNHRPTVRYCRKLPSDPGGHRPEVDGCDVRRHLPVPAAGASSIGHKVGYALGVLRSFLVIVLARQQLVVPWTNSGLEVRAISLAVRLRIRVILVFHNPSPSRDEAFTSPRVLALRKRVSALVVHDEKQAREAREMGYSVHVAGHPAYLAWADDLRVRSQNTGGSGNEPGRGPTDLSGRRSAIFVGAARDDKGFPKLEQLAQELSSRNMDLIVAVGVMDASSYERLTSLSNVFVPGDGARYLSDIDLFDSLKASQVCVAPYDEITTSGSIILALTLGVPVVAFDTPGAAALLREEDLVPVGDLASLAVTAERVCQGPSHWGNPHASVVQLDAASIEQWGRLLELQEAW